MKFARGLAAITSGKEDFKRSTGIWLFTNAKNGQLAWSKLTSNGEQYAAYCMLHILGNIYYFNMTDLTYKL